MAATFLLSPSKVLLSSFAGQHLKGTTNAPIGRVALRGRRCSASLRQPAQSFRKEEPSPLFPAYKTRGGVARVAPATVGKTAGDDDKSLDDQLTKVTVDLPQLSLDALKDALSPLGLKRLQSIPGVFSGTRKSQALVYYDPRLVSRRGKHHAVIFGHGFSQPPENYESTLKRFAREGWVVIAPTTYLSIIQMLTAIIEGAGSKARAPDKLQAALTIDLLRSVQYLFSEKSVAKIDRLLLSGHSMGSGISLVLASYLEDSLVAHVAVMAPAVKSLSVTPLNPSLSMDGRRARYEEAKKFFADQYPQAPLTLIAGNEDEITPPKETSMLFITALKAEEVKKIDRVRMYAVDGSHIGFEDKLNPDITQNFEIIDRIVFPILNFLIYQLEIFTFLLKDFSKQKHLSQELIVSEFKHTLYGSPSIGSSEELTNVATELGISSKDTSALFTPMKMQGDLDKVSMEAVNNIEALADGYGENVDSRPATTLVTAYAAAHSVILLLTLKLAVNYPSFSLGILGVVAAGLVYHNGLLAVGRTFGHLEDGIFIPAEKGEQLQDLSEPSFILHALSPLLVFPALDIASRAGVDWATSPTTTGVVTAGTGIAVVLSLLRHFFVNTLRPKYSAGLLLYTYDQVGVDFTIYVLAVMSFLIGVLSFLSSQNHNELLPFFIGSVAALGLQAIPSKKGNPASLRAQIITGNFGEVILMGSLFYGESVVRTLGL